MAYKDTWKQKNLEKHKEFSRRSMRLWRKRHPEGYRKTQLKIRHGISVAQYDELSENQGGVCAICFQPETAIQKGKTQRLAIDHDHTCCPGKRSCGKCIRGLLCANCNSALGHINDSIPRLKSMIDYVRRSHV